MGSTGIAGHVAVPDGEPLATDLRSYLPSELPEREAEMDELTRMLAPAVQGSTPRNGEVIGPAGQGKTTTVMFLMEALRQRHGVTPLYVDCSACRVGSDVWGQLLKRARIERNQYFPVGEMSGSTPTLISQFKKVVGAIGGSIIVVLDDLDIDDSVDTTLYQLSRFGVDGVKLGTIVISEDGAFRRGVATDANSSWAATRVTFSQYDRPAIESILKRRVGLLEDETVTVSEEAIEAVADCVVNEFGGSARAAIEVMRKARELSSAADPIGSEEITTASEAYRTARVFDAVSQADPVSEAVLVAVLRAAEAACDQEPSFADVYAAYRKVTAEAKLREVAESTVREELAAWIDSGHLTETSDGVVPAFDQELLHDWAGCLDYTELER